MVTTPLAESAAYIVTNFTLVYVGQLYHHVALRNTGNFLRARLQVQQD
jgi:hypothetical protein